MRSDVSNDEPAGEDPDPLAQRHRRRVILAWTWVALWAGLIWILGGDAFSNSDTSEILLPWIQWLLDEIDPRTQYRIYAVLRKAAHPVEYAILAILAFRAAWIAARRGQRRSALLTALFIVASLAAADEARQALSPVRTGSPWDVLIDIAGALVALAGALFVSRRLRTPNPEPTPTATHTATGSSA